MTKDQEINILREFAERLGPDSYFGPVLADQLDTIISEIRADMTPPLPIPVARAAAADIIERAEDHARSRRESADREAERIVAHARRQREDILGGARSYLESAIKGLR